MKRWESAFLWALNNYRQHRFRIHTLWTTQLWLKVFQTACMTIMRLVQPSQRLSRIASQSSHLHNTSLLRRKCQRMKQMWLRMAKRSFVSTHKQIKRVKTRTLRTRSRIKTNEIVLRSYCMTLRHVTKDITTCLKLAVI